MKINVTIDLSDFYTQDDSNSFSDEIKSEIAYRVKQSVWAEFEKKALEQVTSLVKHEFEKQKTKHIEKLVKKVVLTEKIKKSSYDSEPVTIEDYVKETLSKDYFSPSNNAESVMRGMIQSFERKFESEVKQNSTDIAKELKDRYDLLFASQLVAKLNENGMLKDNVAKLLLSQDNES